MEYLSQLKNLSARVEPEWISDHVCWAGVNGIIAHDLLPIPYTYEAVQNIVWLLGWHTSCMYLNE